MSVQADFGAFGRSESIGTLAFVEETETEVYGIVMLAPGISEISEYASLAVSLINVQIARPSREVPGRVFSGEIVELALTFTSIWPDEPAPSELVGFLQTVVRNGVRDGEISPDDGRRILNRYADMESALTEIRDFPRTLDSAVRETARKALA